MTYIINPIRYCLWDSENSRPLSATTHPVVSYESIVDLEFQLESGQFSTEKTYALTIDNDFDFTSDNVMAYAQGTIVNNTLQFRNINTLTAKFRSVINGKSGITAYLQIVEFDTANGVTNRRILCTDWLIAKGVVASDSAEPEELHPLIDRAEAAAERAEAAAESIDPGYTSFYVYAHSETINPAPTTPLGKVTIALPAQMRCKFAIRSYTSNAASDVIIDWGDNTKTILKEATCDTTNWDINGDGLNWTETHADGKTINVFSHLYEVTGKYLVKIIGKDYYSICHWLGVAVNRPEYLDNQPESVKCNLLCECFSKSTKTASHLINFASFARGSQHITLFDAVDTSFSRLQNYALMFCGCENLLSVDGAAAPIVRSTQQMFYNCSNLQSSTVKIPAGSAYTDYAYAMYYGCSNLSSDISSLLPTGGFTAERMDVYQLFAGCSSLTGIPDARYFWGNTNVVFVNQSTAFAGTPFTDLIPSGWGGNIPGKTPDVTDFLFGMPFETDFFASKRRAVRLVQNPSNKLKLESIKGRKAAHFQNNAYFVIDAQRESDLDFKEKDFSICFWAYKDANGSWQSVINKRDSGSTADFYIGFNGDWPCWYNGGTADTFIFGTSNAWHHICYAINASNNTVKAYFDGVLKETYNKHCTTNNRQYLLIGGCSYAADPTVWAGITEGLQAYISDLRVFSRELNAAEITAIYDASAIPNEIEKIRINRTDFSPVNNVIDLGENYAKNQQEANFKSVVINRQNIAITSASNNISAGYYTQIPAQSVTYRLYRKGTSSFEQIILDVDFSNSNSYNFTSAYSDTTIVYNDGSKPDFSIGQKVRFNIEYSYFTKVFLIKWSILA